MGQSKQRKVAFGVLTLAVGALVADKVFLTGDAIGPQAASASPPAAGTAAVQPAPKEERTARAAGTLTDGLRAYANKLKLDPGATPDSFDQAPFLNANAGAAAEPETPEKPTPDFASTHVLQLVFTSSDPSQNVVRVNERRMKVGDEIDGFTLVRIQVDTDGTRWAGFQAGPCRVALKLEDRKLRGD
jgi:hypothetical protein